MVKEKCGEGSRRIVKKEDDSPVSILEQRSPVQWDETGRINIHVSSVDEAEIVRDGFAYRLIDRGGRSPWPIPSVQTAGLRTEHDEYFRDRSISSDSVPRGSLPRRR
ncbi:hypothetical protein WN55_01264 [Dufourea novaeangliae]|uniref:Uncharacterized protein n=1 Tax=Dufourea novaeangliae TaxID=178035 RepID=A0A154NWN0_DUFNO|nr:hypothetical protein WN55_01264 [Dufourea novaeangliae]